MVSSRGLGPPARIKRSFELGQSARISNDQIPAIARAGSNKTTQLHDEAAYIATMEWKHVSEYGRAGLASRHRRNGRGGLSMLGYSLITLVRPSRVYGVGGTLLVRAPKWKTFWQFRRQALTDGITEFG